MKPSSRSRRQQRKSNQSIAHGRKHGAAAVAPEAKNQPLPWKPPSPSPPAHLAPSSPSPPNPRPRSRSPSRIQQQRQSQKVTPSAIAVHEYHLKQQDRLARAAKHRHQSLGDLVRGANDRVAAKDHRDEEIARAEEAAAAAPIVSSPESEVAATITETAQRKGGGRNVMFEADKCEERAANYGGRTEGGEQKSEKTAREVVEGHRARFLHVNRCGRQSRPQAPEHPRLCPPR